jgi:4-amino-4-deoxy-L-arabinose transferase-like glycosyltransferase
MAEATLVLTKPVPSWLERAGRRPVLAILLFVVVGWLPAALVLPPLDRDESRFAEASRQMVDTGNYVDIRFAQTARYKKPIGIYWMQAAAAKLLGPAREQAIWTYRLPSLLGGFVALLVLYGLARGIAPPQTALLASLLLGSTLLVVAESDIATTDAALLACVTGVEAVLMRVYLSARGYQVTSRALVFGGWAALAIGVLLKGPVVVAVAGASVLAISLYDRDWRWLKATRPIAGLALAVLLVAPWAIAIGFASHGAFYQQSLGHDFAAKLLGGEESHGAPPGYYLLLVTFTFWPAILLLLPALGYAVSKRSDPAVRYLLAWGGASWLLFELVPTKLPHYVLPAYPALALLAALWASRPQSGTESFWARVLRIAASAQFVIAALTLAAACVLLPRYFGGIARWPVCAGAVLAFALALAAVVLFLRRRQETAAAMGIVSALAFYLLLALGIAPQLPALWLSPRAAQLVAEHRKPRDPPVVLDGYVEPSLVFLLGADTRIESARTAGAASARTGGLALVEDRDRDLFLSGLRETGASAASQGEVSGLDYSTGRKQHVTLYRVAPAPAGPRRS